VTTAPLLAMTLVSVAVESALAVKPTAEHEAASVGALAEQMSAPVAEKVLQVAGLHSAVGGAVQETVGGCGVITMVSVHEAERPATSVAVQVMTTPLLDSSAAMVTEPSALTVQPVQPGGHAHVGVTGEHMSVAVAETVSGEPSHVEEAAEMEHVIAGGVWSTTVSVCVHMAMAPVESVTWKVSDAPLLPYAVEIEVVPSVLTTQPSALAGHEPDMVREEPQPPDA